MGFWVRISIIMIILLALTSCNAQAPPLNSNQVHIHSHLTIRINGVDQTIPADVGLINGKHLALHTHEPDNIIHLEAYNPTPDYFQLKKFFEIWGKKFSKDCIFDYCTDKGQLTMMVNGVKNDDYEKYVMQDLDQIVIDYSSSK